MRIVAITDIHGAYGTMLRILSEGQPFDAVVLGGDITTRGTASEAREALTQVQVSGKPVFVVAGNMDPPQLDETFAAMGASINARGALLGETGFFGISGGPISPLQTPYEISEEAIARRAEAGWGDVTQARVRVFVPHAPPVNTTVDRIHSGRHVGSKAIRTFIETRRPQVVICGHIHEARGQDAIGNTRIINCGYGGGGYYGVVEIGTQITLRNCQLRNP